MGHPGRMGEGAFPQPTPARPRGSPTSASAVAGARGAEPATCAQPGP